MRRRAVLPWLAGVTGCAPLAPPDRSALPAAGGSPPDYDNPVLPGFHPDPSICRVGDDHYLATSSFEYFPGVPIHHSRDLVNWRLIGHALTWESQLPLQGQAASKGIFAPTLRWHAGRFHLITTNIEGGGNFYVTATDPAGPWSEPVWLREGVFGMDPSLLFDDDGKVYYTRHGGGRHGGVYQAELDLASGRLKGPARLIWSGTGGIWPEGPHLYKRGGWYHLLISEGGTSWDHALTMARSRSPWGPFEPHPDNPILTHRLWPAEPLQMVGHADLVDTADGHSWLVLLGTRPHARHTPLGRETLLAPAAWDDRGWLVVNGGQPLRPRMGGSGLPPRQPWPAVPARDDFDGPELGLEWNFLRSSAAGLWSLTARPGWLRLQGSRTTLSDAATPAFVGRRQTALRQRAVTWMEFVPRAPGDEAGLVLRRDEDHHVRLRVVAAEGTRRIELFTRLGGQERVQARGPQGLPPGPVRLEVQAHPDRYEFAAGPAGADLQPLGAVPVSALSLPNSFTGHYVGVYASGTAVMPPADFDWFEIT